MKYELKKYFESEKIGKISATTDLWTSANKLAIMTITLSWIDSLNVQKDAVIAFRHMVGEHSGFNIAKLFFEVLKEYGIEKKARYNFINKLGLSVLVIIINLIP